MQKRILRTWTFVLACLPVAVIAQDAAIEEVEIEPHKTTVKADEYFDAKEYTTALEIYMKALSKEKSRDQKQRIAFNMAECYRFTAECKRAASYYQRADKMGFGPTAVLGYAEMLQCQGEYEDAIVAYEEYKKAVPGDPRADKGIESCQKAANWVIQGSLFALDNAKDLNSKKSDYAISYAGKRGKEDLTLMISSMRDDATGRKADGWTGQRFSDIYVIEGQRARKKKKRGQEANANNDVKWGDLEPLSEVINTKDHEGVVTFDSRGKTMYFTKCMKVKNVKMGCAIYSTKLIGQDWANPEPVIIALDSGASVGHPALSPDNKTLYFAGEINGGKGGKDIYMTTYDRRARQWNAPTNLNINTRGDELYPYAHGDGYLYFSSNGHVGMGGFDCFRVKLDENGMSVGDVENMLSPVNSEADDIALRWVPGDNTEKGFVISNRKGTRGDHDIWHVTEWSKEFEVSGTVVSSKNGKALKDVTIEVSDKEGNSFSITTDANGRFKIDRGTLGEDKSYKLNLSRKRYLTAVGDVSTKGLMLSDYSQIKEERTYVKSYNLKLVMDPIEVPIVLPNVFFDLAKWDLREESKVALDTVYNILQRNPTITIGLRSHTDYRDTDEKNQVLSQKRAQSCVDYLIEKGIPADRLTAVGMGESEPFEIPQNYAGLGSDLFDAGSVLTESFIRRQGADAQDLANQVNRRTDIKVLSDDYVPSAPVTSEEGGEAGDAKPKKDENPIGQTLTLGPKDRSLGKIAMDNGMNVVELKKLNGGLRGARPLPGMVIKITKNGDYTDFDASHYQVQRGDKINTIAKKNGVSAKDIKQMNDFRNDNDLIVGSWILSK
jgi:peptidoglycan-associated lipoprotein